MTDDIEQEYGHIEVCDNKIVHTLKGQKEFEIPLTDLKVIGEFTNSKGPLLDDYFLTFVTADKWYEIPVDTVGSDKLLIDLQNKLGTNLNLQLSNSTEWKTRIMFPDTMRDKKLYEIKSVKSKRFWDKIKKLIGIKKINYELTNEIKELLKKQINSA